MDITVIGSAIIDILARPVSARVFESGSEPAEDIKLSYGGDACNEAVALSRLGKHVSILSLLGDDEPGKMVLSYLSQNGVDTSAITIHPDIPTSINLVLVESQGERSFVTNPRSSLRRLSEDMILSNLDHMAGIVSFASLFVSHDLSMPAQHRVYKAIKNQPGVTILTTDVTKPKHGETLADIAGFLPYLDVVFANDAEAAMLTGNPDPAANARSIVEAGAGCAVIKTGSRGCEICYGDLPVPIHIPAYPDAHCVDTTGAGDCFAAGFLYALSEGMSYEDCARFGCATASCSIESVGATEGIRSLETIYQRFQTLRTI